MMLFVFFFFFLESQRRRIVDTRLEHQLVRTRLISSHTAELDELRITMETMETMETLEDRDRRGSKRPHGKSGPGTDMGLAVTRAPKRAWCFATQR